MDPIQIFFQKILFGEQEKEFRRCVILYLVSNSCENCTSEKQCEEVFTSMRWRTMYVQYSRSGAFQGLVRQVKSSLKGWKEAAFHRQYYLQEVSPSRWSITELFSYRTRKSHDHEIFSLFE